MHIFMMDRWCFYMVIYEYSKRKNKKLYNIFYRTTINSNFWFIDSITFIYVHIYVWYTSSISDGTDYVSSHYKMFCSPTSLYPNFSRFAFHATSIDTRNIMRWNHCKNKQIVASFKLLPIIEMIIWRTLYQLLKVI